MENALILAIESSTSVASIGLFKEEKLLGLINYYKERMHARFLAPMIEKLLEDMEVKPSDLNAVAVSRGPGSYTGLRVGVSIAKGLCLSLNIPLISLGSDELLALQVKDLAKEMNALICPMIDARRMEVYMSLFDENMNLRESVSPRIINEEFPDSLPGERKIIFVGDGVRKLKPIIGQYPDYILLPETLASVYASGETLYNHYANSNFEDLVKFEPHYLKSFVATKPKKIL